MGHNYRKLQESKAWQHFRDNVLTLRESMVQAWLAGKAGAENYRLTIKLCDDLLRVPQKMIEEGKRAQSIVDRAKQERANGPIAQ